MLSRGLEGWAGRKAQEGGDKAYKDLIPVVHQKRHCKAIVLQLKA